LRLAYSGVTPADIEEGVRRLADAYAEVATVAEPAAGAHAA
jgi:DNA-binding transcriptional MocR family regulator